jgi:PST family polysaccharide transporter
LRVATLQSVAGFSLNLTGFQILNWFIRNLDHILIGHYFGATLLGYYALAYRLILFPLQGVGGVVARVMFPVYSRMKDDPERLRNAYLRVTTTTAIVLFPVMAGIAIVVRPLIATVYGESWMPVVPLIQIFAGVGIVQTVCGSVGVIYQAVGRTDLMFRWALVASAMVVAGVFIGIQWGIIGVAAGFAVVSLVATWPSLAIPYRLIGLRISTVVEQLTRPLLATAMMAGATLLIDLSVRSRLDPLSHLIVVIAGGVVSYLVASLLVNRHRVGEIYTLMLTRGRRA